MPINTLGYCNKIMRVAKEKGFESEISFADLKEIIRLHVGSRKDTVRRYMMELVDFGFITGKGNNIYIILKTEIEVL